MLRSGKHVRFNSAEVDEARKLGLNLSEVETEEHLIDGLIELVKTLEQQRPSLLEKVAVALAAKTGRKLPARLTVVK